MYHRPWPYPAWPYLLDVPDERLVVVAGRADVARAVRGPRHTVHTGPVITETGHWGARYPYVQNDHLGREAGVTETGHWGTRYPYVQDDHLGWEAGVTETGYWGARYPYAQNDHLGRRKGTSDEDPRHHISFWHYMLL